MKAEQAGGPVVVGIDESDSAREAVRFAAADAQRRHATLRIVLAFSLSDPVGGFDRAGIGEHYRESAVQAAEAALDAAEAVARDVAPDIEVEKDLRAGFPVPVLLDESERARTVVLGSRGLGGFAGLLIGSVAVALAARGQSPVVVVRELPPAPTAAEGGTEAPLPVVVGVDGSPTSEAAVAFAYEEAALRGAPLVAVHTWTDYAIEPTIATMIDWNAIEDDERLVLGERLAGWSAKYPDVEVSRVVVRDRPAHALVEQSKSAQLVVVGSRGRGGAAGLFLGSVSHGVLHHAHCPVAIVRPEAPAKED